MRDTLVDIVKNTAPYFKKLKITGTSEDTKIEAFTEDKMMFLVGHLSKPVSQFTGQFGISNLGLLKGLLDFPSYKGEDAKFEVHRAIREEAETVSEFEFKAREGAGAKFRTMSAQRVGEQAKIASIPWEITLSLPRAKISEITQLIGLFSEVDKKFGMAVENNNLYMTIGGDSEVTHAATIELSQNVDNKLLSEKWSYDTSNFLSVLKGAGSANFTINLCSRGVIGINVESDKGSYLYYLRGKQA